MKSLSAIAAAAAVLIGLLAFGTYWTFSDSLPPHIDPNLTISDIKTRHEWSGGQKILFTITDSHQYLFSKSLKLGIHILESDGFTSHDISKQVKPGEQSYDLPSLAPGNNGWTVNVEVEDSHGEKATARERSIHIGDDDFID